MSLHEMFTDNRIFELEQRVSYLETVTSLLTKRLIEAGIIDITKSEENKEEEK